MTTKFAPISYVVQKTRERPTKTNPQRFSGMRSKGMLNRREETKTCQVCGQVTKTGQTIPTRTGKQNHHNFSGWLRKWSEQKQWLEGEGSAPTQARKHTRWSRVGQPEESG